MAEEEKGKVEEKYMEMEYQDGDEDNEKQEEKINKIRMIKSDGDENNEGMEEEERREAEENDE